MFVALKECSLIISQCLNLSKLLSDIPAIVADLPIISDLYLPGKTSTKLGLNELFKLDLLK